MRIVTFENKEDLTQHLGVLVSDESVFDLSRAAHGDKDLFSMQTLLDRGTLGLNTVRALISSVGDISLSTYTYKLDDNVHLLAPLSRPRKNVYCVGLNFRSHIEQNAAALNEPVVVPEKPLFFTKPTTAVVGHGDVIRFDRRLTSKLDYEVELAIIIGRRGTWIPQEEAWQYIFGFTILNDISARDLQWRSSQFLYGKGQDSYCPLGPAVTPTKDMPPWNEVTLRLWVNDELRQEETANNLLFKPEAIVAELSRGITLEPGDVISLGTPGGCGYQMTPPRFMNPGDSVECEITGIGRLRNPVIEVTPSLE